MNDETMNTTISEGEVAATIDSTTLDSQLAGVAADQLQLDLRSDEEVKASELKYLTSRILSLHGRHYSESRRETVRNAQEAYGLIAEKSVAVTQTNKQITKGLNAVLLSLGDVDEGKPVDEIASLGNTVNDLILAAIDMLSVTQYADRCLMNNLSMGNTPTNSDGEDENAPDSPWMDAESRGDGWMGNSSSEGQNATESNLEDVRAILQFPGGPTSSDPEGDANTDPDTTEEE